MTSNSVFQKILDECEEAKAKLQANDFFTEKGLYAKLSKERLSAEISGTENLELYLVQQDAHHCLQEIGRLREEAFRRSGGGTQKQIDLDDWDYSGFWQLLCIDTEAKEICGAYRLLYGPEVCAREQSALMGSVHSLFEFSPTMLEQILPRSIELGRSFVNEEAKQARLALTFLFEALGQLLCQNADYVLGKITFYPETLSPATLLLLDRFFEHYWGEQNNPLPLPQRDSQKDSLPLVPLVPLARPREGLDFRSIPLIQEAPFSKTEFEQLAERLLSELPPKFDRQALHTLLDYTEECHKLSRGTQSTQDSDTTDSIKHSKRTLLRGLTLFLKYISSLREDTNGMYYYGGAVNPNFGNVIEFMNMVEVRQFRNLQRWV